MPILDQRLGNKLSRMRHRIAPVPIVKQEGEPISRVFGLDRGTSIDRYWIESFLARNASPLPGKALEVGSTRYIRQYFPNCRAHSLQLRDNGSSECVICDLEVGDPALADTFDVFVTTQVFNFIFETRTALRNASQMLKPGGVLLGTVAAITQVSRYDADRWGHFYSFTTQAWQRLLGEVFQDVTVESFGNVDTACAFLNGLSAEELPAALLDRHDPDYPVVLGFRASNPAWQT